LGHVFSQNSTEFYVRLILSPSHHQPTDEEKSFRRFMQDNAIALTSNTSMNALGEVFCKQVINQGMGPL
jgi:hypothetical protein